MTVSSSPSCLDLVPVAIGLKRSDREKTRVRPTSLLIPMLSFLGALPDSFLESVRTSMLANISKLMARLLRHRVGRGACPGHRVVVRLERTLATGPELAPPRWTLSPSGL